MKGSVLGRIAKKREKLFALESTLGQQSLRHAVEHSPAVAQCFARAVERAQGDLSLAENVIVEELTFKPYW
jgi:hypothetical protein